MSSKWRVVIALAAFAPVLGCGGGGGSSSSVANQTATPAGISVTVAPSSANVGPGQTQQFAATVVNTGSTGVTWQVNGAPGGSPATGTISASGLYSAPLTTPSPNTIAITAISIADKSKKANARVVIIPNRAQQVIPISLGASGGNQQDFHISGNTETCCSGTLGALLSRGGVLYVLSNNHVLGRENQAKPGEQIDSPGMVDTNCQSGTPVATFSQAVPLPPNGAGTVDAAIGQVIPGTVDPAGSILQLSPAGGNPPAAAPPSGTPEAALVGMTLAKSGRTTGLTCGPVQSVNTTVSVDYQQGCGSGATFKVTFSNQVMVNSASFSDSGDSGSLMVDATTAGPVALLYGGSNNTTVGNPIIDVLGALSNAQGSATIVGGAPHPVSCPAASASASAQKLQVTVPRLALATAVANRNSAILMNDPAVLGVSAGASADSPGDPAVVLFVDPAQRARAMPATIEGLRTRIVRASPMRNTPVVPAALTVAEILRASLVKEKHAALWMHNPAVFAVGVAASEDSPGEAAIIVYVDQAASFSLPPVVEGVRTKIFRTSRIRTFDWKEHGSSDPPRSCTVQKATARPFLSEF
jgi:hypothetical protein